MEESIAFLNFVDVELCHLEKNIPAAAFMETDSQLMLSDVVLEFLSVGHLSEVYSAKIFQHWLDILHKFVQESPLLV